MVAAVARAVNQRGAVVGQDREQAEMSSSRERKQRIERSAKIIGYVKGQAGSLLSEPVIEQIYNEFDRKDIIWSVKTEHGNYWVVDSPEMPLNIYPKEPRALTPDEIYSMHIGITARLTQKTTEKS